MYYTSGCAIVLPDINDPDKEPKEEETWPNDMCNNCDPVAFPRCNLCLGA